MAQKTMQRTPQAAQPNVEKNTKPKRVVTFTSEDGEVYEIPDLPENLGRATALASERSLSKTWGSEAESEACQNMLREKWS